MTQCDNIIFHRVNKGYQDIIMYEDCAERALEPVDNYVSIIKACAAKNEFTDARDAPVRRDPNAHLTIACRKGRNAYVICLDHLSSTSFVENARPILSLASFYPPFENLISEVTLYYTREGKVGKEVVAQGEKEKFIKPKGYDVPQWASFVVDSNAHAINENRTDNINNLRLPLHFNLYNEAFDMPNWIAANHKGQHQKQEQGDGDGHGHDEQGQHLKLVFVHGGPHPDLAKNFLEIDLGP